MTVHRKRTAAEWEHSEWCLVDDDLRDLYLSNAFPPSKGWMTNAFRLVLVVLACLLVAWLVWGGRG